MTSVITDSTAMLLTDFLRGQCLQTLEEVLENVAAAMDVRHISYVRFVSHSDSRIINTIVTFPIAWQNHYSERSYFLIDPVVTFGCACVTPFDWDEIRTDDSNIAAFFDDATAHDIGRNGVSLPVRNRDGGFALVSFTSDHSKRKWSKYKKNNMTALQSMAALINSAASFTRKAPPFPPALSENEKRYLILFARQRSINDIAEEVCVSPSVVNLYLDNARHKLRCVSLTQAVAIAIATGAISPDHSR